MLEPRLVDGVEMARILSIAPSTLKAWRKAGLIPYMKVNPSTIRYDVEDVIGTLRDRSSVDRATEDRRRKHPLHPELPHGGASHA